MTKKTHKIPVAIQLPGNLQFHRIWCRVLSYDSAGRPQTFEILPPGEPPADTKDVYFFYAHEESVRNPDASKKQS